MKQLDAVKHYLKHTAIPNKLGRVIYNTTNKKVINAIRDAGLTPIPLREYRKLQAAQAGRPYITGGYT